MTNRISRLHYYVYSYLREDFLDMLKDDSGIDHFPDEVENFLASVPGNVVDIQWDYKNDVLSVCPSNTGSRMFDSSLVDKSNAEYLIDEFSDVFTMYDGEHGLEIEVWQNTNSTEYAHGELLEDLLQDMIRLDDYMVLDEYGLSQKRHDVEVEFVTENLIPSLAHDLEDRVDFEFEIDELKLLNAFWAAMSDGGWVFEGAEENSFPYFYGQNATEFEMWKESLDPNDFRVDN